MISTMDKAGVDSAKRHFILSYNFPFSHTHKKKQFYSCDATRSQRQIIFTRF